MKLLRLSALRTFTSQKIFLILISLRVWGNSWAIVRPEGLCQWKIPMTPPGFEPATFRLVAHCLNQLRHRVPPSDLILWRNFKVQYNKDSFSILPNFWNAALKTAPCTTDIFMSKIVVSKPAGKIIITVTKYATCIWQFSASSATSQNTKRKFLKMTKSQILQATEACGCDFPSRKPVKCLNVSKRIKSKSKRGCFLEGTKTLIASSPSDWQKHNIRNMVVVLNIKENSRW